MNAKFRHIHLLVTVFLCSRLILHPASITHDSSFDYRLYADGQRASVTEADGKEIDWTYDNLNRLTQEQVVNGYTADYIYDLVGNRLMSHSGNGRKSLAFRRRL